MRNRLGADDIEGGCGPELGIQPEETYYASEKDRRVDSLIRSYYLRCEAYLNMLFFGKRGPVRESSPILPPPPFVNEHSSFRVIGYEIGWMSSSLQYLYCAGGVVIFLVLYGVLQEHVVMNKFHRSLGWFITFLQLGGYGIFAAALDSFVGSHKREGKIPFHLYIILGFLQVLMQGFTNLSMHYLNYPAKTMFKSSRVIMTMLFGVAFMGKRYQLVNYAVALCIVCGLTLCVVADAETSPEFSLSGIVLIMLALCADAAILNIQEFCLNKYEVTHDELIYYSFTVAAVLAVAMSMISGEFLDGFRFLGTDGTIQVFGLFVIFTLSGFLGMSCLAALTKRFGALKSAVTSTVRKGVTLILSYIIFPEGKVFTILHAVGTIIFLGGLFLESTTKLKRSPKAAENIMSEEDEEIGIITGDINSVEPLLPISVESDSVVDVDVEKINVVTVSNVNEITKTDFGNPLELNVLSSPVKYVGSPRSSTSDRELNKGNAVSISISSPSLVTRVSNSSNVVPKVLNGRVSVN